MHQSQEKLAICGGTSVFPAGPPSWPRPDAAVQDALALVYHDGNWGRYHGDHCEMLRELLRNAHDVKHVRLCSSGTVGMELALRALDIEKDDEVILGGYDFAGNFRAIEHIGARPVLTDIDPVTGCVSVETLEQATSMQTRAAIISHLHSGVANMPAIMKWAADRDVRVVEDACQAPGAMIENKIAGSWGDVGVLSFGGSKLLTAGRGGAVLLNDARQHQRLKVFAERGNDAYPLSELQAAVLIPQWKTLGEQNARRQLAVRRLTSAVGDTNYLKFVGNSTQLDVPSYYKVGWRLAGPASRTEFIAAIQAEGVAIDAGFRGFTRRSARRCRRAMELTNSSQNASSLVTLHHPVLLESNETIDRVAAALHKVARALEKAK